MKQKPVATRRRGIALIFVMLAMAVASVLILSLLNTEAVHAQISSTSTVRVQAQYLAESGLNLAVYYLKNPSSSPIALIYGTSGNVHYPGETGIAINGMAGTVDVAVTNPANGMFAITSTGTFDGTAVTATSSIAIGKMKQFTYAGYFIGPVTLNSKTSVTGGVITNGPLQQSYVGQVSGASTTSSSGTSADLQDPNSGYPISMLHYLPTYFYKGKTCTAKAITANFAGGTLSDDDTTSNPANVWYIGQSGIKFTGTTTLAGSLVTASGMSVTITGTVTITPVANMPALVVGSDLTFNATTAAVTANGPTYLGGQVKGTGTTTNANFNVNGVLIGAQSGYPVNSTYKGTVTLHYLAQQAKTVAFADEMETIQSVTDESWETDNSRPQ